MSKIDHIIPQQRLELVSIQLAKILALELKNQYELTNDEALKCTVWVDRFIAFDKTELPAINVTFTKGTNTANTPETSKYDYDYAIMVYVNSKSNAVKRGDVTAFRSLLRFAGLIRYILMNPHYLNLDFVEKFIYTRSIAEIDAQLSGAPDGTYSISSGLTYSITLEELNGSVDSVNVSEVTSQIKLDLTEKGYKITIKN